MLYWLGILLFCVATWVTVATLFVGLLHDPAWLIAETPGYLLLAIALFAAATAAEILWGNWRDRRPRGPRKRMQD